MTLLRSNTLRALALLSFLGGCGPRDVQTAGSLVGEWKGHVAWRDGTTPLVLHVRADGDSLAATLDAPALGVSAQPIGRVSFDSPRVHFAVADSAGTVAFDGWLRRGLVVGALSGGPLAAETNRALLPQLSLKQAVKPAKPSPWPEGVVGAEPPLESAKERSLAEWLAR
ncbi:MAG: hypothetical protein HZA61_11435 [Candidatus Eisenbacteria bacterium]|uniref:Uncharacterized protein n=1 Tax=Eiseniibacteriota bacterium TaxID=2212470 RepID=A0A933SGT7_UNCEI|nr:hypothetical protein [Candidatus Eisenbacteria bacterium]